MGNLNTASHQDDQTDAIVQRGLFADMQLTGSDFAPWDPEQITEGDIIHEISKYSHAIQSVFPGGMSGFIQFMPYLKLLDEDRVFDVMRRWFKDWAFPRQNAQTYVDVGKTVLEKLGVKGDSYLFSFYKFNPDLKKLLTNDPVAFASQIDKAIALECGFSVCHQQLSSSACVLDNTFGAFIKYGNQHNFPRFIASYKKVTKRALEIAKEKGCKCDDDLSRDLDYVLETFREIYDDDEFKGGRFIYFEDKDFADIFIECVFDHSNDIATNAWNFQELLQCAYLSVEEIYAVLITGDGSCIDPNNIDRSKIRLSFDVHSLISQLEPGKSFEHQRKRLIAIKDALPTGVDPLYKFINNECKRRIDESINKLELPIKCERFMRIVGAENIKSNKLSNANSSTRMAIAGTALLGSLGLQQARVLSPCHKLLPQSADPIILKRLQQGDLGALTNSQQPIDQGNLARSIDVMMPDIEASIYNARLRSIGLMPIGGKVHVDKVIDKDLLKFLQHIFHLDTTPFHLIHAGQTLNLPPLPTAQEQALLLMILQSFGAINEENPELQAALAGRWSRETAALIGSAVLLATERGWRYDDNAFSTNQNESTGARIMSYDGGLSYKVTGLPFDLLAAEGRTDMLGRRIHSDLDLYQVLGTLATHYEYNGFFIKEAAIFRSKMAEILDRHALLPIINSSAWVYDHVKNGDSLENHGNMVRVVSEKWFEGRDLGAEKNYGIIGEVRGLIDIVRVAMQARIPQICREQPEEVERFMHY